MYPDAYVMQRVGFVCLRLSRACSIYIYMYIFACVAAHAARDPTGLTFFLVPRVGLCCRSRCLTFIRSNIVHPALREGCYGRGESEGRGEKGTVAERGDRHEEASRRGVTRQNPVPSGENTCICIVSSTSTRYVHAYEC